MKIKVVLLAMAFAATARAGDKEISPEQVVPPTQDQWEFKLALPGWATWLQGDNTLNGHTAHIDLGPNHIIPRVDMTADVKFEAHKGRFSVLGEFLYLSLSDGIGTNTVVKKMDMQVDQMMADLAVAWRVYESPKAYVDILGGVRYTNFYQQLALQPNDSHIEDVARKIAVVPTAVNIARELQALQGKNPTVPIGPIDAGDIRKILAAINKVKSAAAKIKSIPDAIAYRQAKIEGILHHALDRQVSRLDDWWDPYVGVRARYNLNEKLYLTGRADIGGFGLGSEVSWQAEAAFGMMVTKNVYSEVGYRAIGVDYDQDGMHMETITHGVELTLGVVF